MTSYWRLFPQPHSCFFIPSRNYFPGIWLSSGPLVFLELAPICSSIERPPTCTVLSQHTGALWRAHVVLFTRHKAHLSCAHTRSARRLTLSHAHICRSHRSASSPSPRSGIRRRCMMHARTAAARPDPLTLRRSSQSISSGANLISSQPYSAAYGAGSLGSGSVHHFGCSLSPVRSYCAQLVINDTLYRHSAPRSTMPSVGAPHIDTQS